MRSFLYLFSIVALTATGSLLCFTSLVSPASGLIPLAWIAGFTILFFSVSYVLVSSIVYLFTRPNHLPELAATPELPCALVYPVRNEPIGLFERIDYTLGNNNLPGVKLCFLSDSDFEFLSYENGVVTRLRQKYGVGKIYYWHRKKPVERKQGNINGWLSHHYHEFRYFMVCDADSMVPRGVLAKLLRKAEHPTNRDVAIFQTRISIAHAKTIFSRWQEIGTRVAQRLYIDVNQRVFGRSLSFGHGNLIRSELMLKINLPKGTLSHDIWDMVFLDAMGFRTVFCPDVVTFEESPAHFLIMRARDRRWIKGNLQTYPLLFEKESSLGARFYVFYGLYMYLCQPVFLLWLTLSLMANTGRWGHFLLFKPILLFGQAITMSHISMGVLAVIFLHKFVICKTMRDLSETAYETALSSLISLNNIVYHTLDIISLIFKSIGWVPMNKDPFEKLTLKEAAKGLWPGTLAGVALLYLASLSDTRFFLFSLPVCLSLTVSIPVAYLTSRSGHSRS